MTNSEFNNLSALQGGAIYVEELDASKDNDDHYFLIEATKFDSNSA